jgi:hypothetical protein
MAIDSTAINAADTTLFTASQETAVTCIWVCNTNTYDPNNPTVGQTTLNLHFVKSTDAVALTKNKIVNTLTVPAGETVTFDTEKIILEAGDKVIANAASGSILVATISTITVAGP